MPDPGDEVLLVLDDVGLSETVPSTDDDAFLFSDGFARGESGQPTSGDQCFLPTPDLALVGGSLKASGDLQISISKTTSPVTEGETLTVIADITNNNSTEESGNIVLGIGGKSRDSETVTIGSNSTKQISLGWVTSEGDAGDYTATVESGTDADTASVTVQKAEKVPSGDLDVQIESTNSPVGEGATVTVEVFVQNNNSTEEDGNITLYTGGTYRDNRGVSVPGDGQTYVTLVWDTASGDAGDYTATVESGTDSDTAPITVEAVSNIEEKTIQITEDLSQFDDTGSWDVDVIASPSDPTRFVEVTVFFEQNTTFRASQSGVGMDHQNGGPNGTISFEAQEFIAWVPQADSFSKTLTIDLGYTDTGDIFATCDDGTAEWTIP